MRLFQPTYTKDRPTGHGCLDERVTKTSKVWWCEFVVNGRSFRESTGLRDKAAATSFATARLREEELRAAGIETHGGTSRATLACLLDEYRADMARRGLAPKHVDTTIARCRALTQGVETIANLTPTAVRLGLERLRGASAKTVNGYRTALHGFCEWLVKGGRWASNPVAAVERSREVADGPVRRALTPDEQKRLLDLVGHGTDRWLCYYVALNTGLRRAELAALTYADIIKVPSTTGQPDDFINDRYAVRVRAGSAKNRKEALLPLPSGLWLRRPEKPSLRPCRPPSMRAFRRDLKDAGIEADGPDGKVDFHSLRVTFATNLARAGVPLVMAQRLMRHSNPALTANIYTRLRIDDEQAAVDRAIPDCFKEAGLARACVGAAVPAAGLPGTLGAVGFRPSENPIPGD
jgi:integrase